MHSLIINNLTKVFNSEKSWFSILGNDRPEFLAINNISFSLGQGEIVGLIGPNGAGKSTLIHMLLGILFPSSGSIHYFGQDFSKNRSSILQNISFASSSSHVIQTLTVIQNLQFFARIYTMSQERRDKAIDDLLSNFGLSAQKHNKVSTLSSGESSKIGILKAFLPDTKIVLLDEPTAFLDVQTAALIRTLIKERRQKLGTTFFLTSHNPHDIFELCDRIIILEEGCIKEICNPEKLDNGTFDFFRSKGFCDKF